MPSEIIGTVQNAGTGLGETATGLTFSRPSNALQVGDFVWAVFSQRGSTAAPATPPSGWTTTGFTSNATAPGGGSGLWYRRFTSQSDIDADTGSYSASFGARALIVSCGIVRGSDGVSAPSNAANTSTVASLTYASIASTRASLCLAWLARSNDDLAPAYTEPSGFTELADFWSSGQENSHGVASRNFTGDTGNITYSYPATTNRLSGGIILFYDTPDVTLSGAIAATSGLSGSLTVEKPIAGAIAAVSTLSGSLSADKPLSATIAAVSGLSGDLTTEKPLTGDVAAIAGLSGALTVEKPLSGELGAIAELAGSLSVDKTLSGTIAAVSGLTGALNSEGGKELAGAIAAVSGLSGSLTVEKPLAGVIAAVSAMTGNLSEPISGLRIVALSESPIAIAALEDQSIRITATA